ncbi:MAG: hypothetical protein ABFS17_07475 [Chloroflexota bacterium]
MGKSIRFTTLLVVLLLATLACQPFPTASPQGPAPSTEVVSAPATSAPLVLPTIIEATATNPPPEMPTEPGQIFIDDFSNQDSGWSQHYTDNADWDYYMGGYRVSVRTSGVAAVNYLMDHDYENVRLVVDARKIGGQEENLYGLICRQEEETSSFYAAVISSTGHYAILKLAKGESVNISKNYEQSVVINQGLTLNLIEMSCTGNRISLTVNGVLLSEVYDNSFQIGTVGMFVTTANTESADVLFDNFHLYLEE